MPFTRVLYQDIRFFHQYYCLQTSGWTVHQCVTEHIYTESLDMKKLPPALLIVFFSDR